MTVRLSWFFRLSVGKVANSQMQIFLFFSFRRERRMVSFVKEGRRNFTRSRQGVSTETFMVGLQRVTFCLELLVVFCYVIWVIFTSGSRLAKLQCSIIFVLMKLYMESFIWIIWVWAFGRGRWQGVVSDGCNFYVNFLCVGFFFFSSYYRFIQIIKIIIVCYKNILGIFEKY